MRTPTATDGTVVRRGAAPLDLLAAATFIEEMCRGSHAALITATLLVAMTARAQPNRARLGAEIAAQLHRSDAVDVFVMLGEPSALRQHDLLARRAAVRSAQDTVLSSMQADEVLVHERFAVVSGFTATVTAGGLSKLLANTAVRRIDAMRFGSGADVQSLSQIRADTVHRRDDEGQGVTVAVLDSGVDVTHPDLAGSIVAEQCFCSGNCCPDGSSREAGPGSAFTTFVHGIHVTGIIVAKGIVAPVGVAPGADVVAVKVLNDSNRGAIIDWIAALDWIVANREDVQAINMSLVSDQLYSSPCDDADAFTMAFAQVLGTLRARGTLVFVAAGNNGTIDMMAAPACVGAAVAVGAVSKVGDVAPFSDSGPALDLLAPGLGILSTGINHSTAILSGTSMAAPHATGTAALLLAMNPDLGADALERVLEATGNSLLDRRNGLTFPRINALAAVDAVVHSTTPLTGNGSLRSDCLVEWNFTPASVAMWGLIPRAVCRDNDPSCDADQLAGQCTFQLSVCFNVADRRLPSCSPAAAIVERQLITPNAAQPQDAVDAANGDAITAALPAVPVTEPGRCTAAIPFVVPAGGARWIRFVARAADGRSDHDRLRLACLPGP